MEKTKPTELFQGTVMQDLCYHPQRNHQATIIVPHTKKFIYFVYARLYYFIFALIILYLKSFKLILLFIKPRRQ